MRVFFPEERTSQRLLYSPEFTDLMPKGGTEWMSLNMSERTLAR